VCVIIIIIIIIDLFIFNFYKFVNYFFFKKNKKIVACWNLTFNNFLYIMF